MAVSIDGKEHKLNKTVDLKNVMQEGKIGTINWSNPEATLTYSI